MHPASSVILFTTASGAGYGLLALLGLLGPAGLVPQGRWFGFVGLGVALALVTAGLLASTFHLGHPERAWRAVSQWRSSWLSREGVMALLTYAPAGVFGVGWVFLERPDRVWAAAGVLAALAAAWILKVVYWRRIDATRSESTPESATGLGALGTVRQLDPPHSEENYLLSEMGFRVARKHAVKLRGIALSAGAALPLILTAIQLGVQGPLAAVLAVLGVLAAGLGIAIERWLFFAEATHTVTLYYGRQA